MDDTKYWVWLSTAFKSSGRNIWELMCFYEDAAEAYYDLTSSSPMVKLSEKEKENINSYTLAQIEEIISKNNSKGINVLTYSSEKYPDMLRLIANPPPVLYYKGNINCLSHDKIITSVGTRRPSRYSINAADNICRELAEKGIVIASGFAVGIDITSHLAAVAKNMPTICVLGCGIDVNYPADNFAYRDRIIESGGLFISEYQYNSAVRSINFPKRNRILSAIGRAAMVFQASDKSGAIITANCAAEQGREVFCLPPADIFDNAYSGNKALLRDGALPLFGAEDIFAYLDMEILPVYDISEENKHIKIQNKNKKEADKPTEKIQVSAEVPKNSDYTDIQNEIMQLLCEGPLHADIMAQKLDLDTTALMTELTELELVGALKSMPGKMFDIKK